MRVIVFADDLTGAASSAALLRQRGLRSSIFNFPKFPKDTATLEALVFNTCTRDLTESEAKARVESSIANLSQSCEPLFWGKRIDTTLRGPVRAELQILLTRIAPAGGVLAPAHPEGKRVTRQGIQFLNSEPVGDLKKLIAGLPGVRTTHIGGSYTHAKGEWWVPDIKNPGNIEAAARTLAPYRHELLVVDSGPLTAAIAGIGVSVRKVLVIQGSGSEQTRRQIRYLAWSNRLGVEMLYHPLHGQDDRNIDMLVAATQQKLSRGGFAGIVVGGGLTAEAIIESLNSEAIEPVGSPMPLMALSRLKGGDYHNLLIATKGGVVGGVEALVYLVDLVKMWE